MFAPAVPCDENINRTRWEHNEIGETIMTEMLQDVAALVSMSVFIVSLAMWIGAY